MQSKELNIGFIGSPSYRTYFYLKTIKNAGFTLKKTLIYNSKKTFSITNKFPKIHNLDDTEIILNEDYYQLIESFNADKTDKTSFNELAEEVSSFPTDLIIFSGKGGDILKDEILSLGKKFIHVHPGKLPQYKGSTTFYYSILNENSCTATAFFMNRDIDDGEIIQSKTYSPPSKNIECVDSLYDPLIRSDLLLNVLHSYSSKGILDSNKQVQESPQTYYVIHPVLKNIALKQTGHAPF